MQTLKCTDCNMEYTDLDSIKLAQLTAEDWQAMCRADGDEPKGIAPCPLIGCKGEMVLI